MCSPFGRIFHQRQTLIKVSFKLAPTAPNLVLYYFNKILNMFLLISILCKQVPTNSLFYHIDFEKQF